MAVDRDMCTSRTDREKSKCDSNIKYWCKNHPLGQHFKTVWKLEKKNGIRRSLLKKIRSCIWELVVILSVENKVLLWLTMQWIAYCSFWADCNPTSVVRAWMPWMWKYYIVLLYNMNFITLVNFAKPLEDIWRRHILPETKQEGC